jgi:hypothetical protein
LIFANPAEGVADATKHKGRLGQFDDYAAGYWLVTDREDVEPKVLAGPSRGGVVVQFLAMQRPAEVVNVQESVTVACATPTISDDLKFALIKVGARDNIRDNKQNKVSDPLDEAVFSDEEFNQRLIAGTEFSQPGPAQMLYRAAGPERWMTFGINRASTASRMVQAIADNPGMHVVYTHGRHDIGMPIERARAGMRLMYGELPASAWKQLHYLESDTGHYGTGHTGRFGRLVAMAIDLSQRAN